MFEIENVLYLIMLFCLNTYSIIVYLYA